MKEIKLNESDVCGGFSRVADSKATEALQFYENCADHIAYCEASGKEIGFDWNQCRAYCRVGKTYSHLRFMAYVANFFNTTVKEMKLQWRNVK
jgi:hypothetical protein